MALKLFNTLGRRWEVFTPIDASEVKIYSCGPTVYDYPHLGNYRAYLAADILKRALIYNGYKVKQVMNITDVDDKTIKNAQAAGKSLSEFTNFYTQAFFRDRDTLNILPATIYTKASDYIPQMVKLIEELLAKNYAYKTTEGNVYFSIQSYAEYGQLAQVKPGNLETNAAGRLNLNDEYEKESVQDFALWKAWTSEDGEVYWETSLGKGRPGWHIECSAMSMENLGQHFDIHTGGVDNIFPHHENEIAQSQCATGHQFVNYWLHNEWLLVEGKKMAKSAGNFYTLRDILEKGYSPLAYRYLTLTTHYRKPLNFTWESLSAAQTALTRLQDKLLEIEEGGEVDKNYNKKFTEALAEDLNAPQALSILWEVMNDKLLSPANQKATALKFDEVLGLDLAKVKKLEVPEEVKKLLAEREEARQSKDFARADQLRAQIDSLGYSLDDTPSGPKLKQK